jgi:large subunit ribosomal protein L5
MKLNLSQISNSKLLKKIVINRGLGVEGGNTGKFEKSSNELAMITGQQPVPTIAKNSIAGFQIRKGMTIGMMVTLRRKRMYDFLIKLIHVALPQVRDFEGLSSTSFDGAGNYTFGINEQVIFPEIDYEETFETAGLTITIVTKATNNEEGYKDLKSLGFPFSN